MAATRTTLIRRTDMRAMPRRNWHQTIPSIQISASLWHPSSSSFIASTRLVETSLRHSTASRVLQVILQLVSKARFAAALDWIVKARQYHHTSIIRAYTMSLALLTRFLIATPSVELQHKFLRSTAIIPKTLASDAAAAAIDASQLDTAVEFLEQGRTILWSEMRNFRPPLERLREVNPAYADELRDLTSQLEHQATSFEGASISNESTRSAGG